jgi:hypothetical protein
VGKVHYFSGFADVSDGEYLGCSVAIKRLRVSEDDSDKVFKVRISFNLSRDRKALNPFLAILPRGYWLEILDPPKHSAAVRNRCVRGTKLFLYSYRMDA